VTSIEAYGCGYVAIDVQSLLDGEDHRGFLQLYGALEYYEKPSALKVSTSRDRTELLQM
jgi:hypothetical protein